MTVRISQLFLQGNAGWSESWYSNLDIDSANALANEFATVRRFLLSNDASMLGHRVSQVDPIGLSYVVRYQNFAGQAALQVDPAYSSLILRVFTASTHRRNHLLRGLPDARCVNGAYEGSSAYDAAITAYFDFLKTRDLRMKTVNFGNALLPIKSIDGTGKMTLVPGTEGVAAQKWQLYKTRATDHTNVSGIYTISGEALPATGTLLNWPAGLVVTKGQARLYTVSYERITSTYNTRRVVSRRVGRPFGLPVGRRRSRR